MMKAEEQKNGLYRALKQRETAEGGRTSDANAGEMALDDTERVKILSPGRLVAKRFFRNKLAMTGLAVLIAMFAFSFLGVIFYPYSQTDVFYKYDYLNVNYASATERTENVSYPIPGGPALGNTTRNLFNSYILELEEEGTTEKDIAGRDGEELRIAKLGDKVYTLFAEQTVNVGTYRQSADIGVYDVITGWQGTPPEEELGAAAAAAIDAGDTEFLYGGARYSVFSSMKNRYTVRLDEPMMEFEADSPGAGFLAVLEQNLGGTEFVFADKSYRVSDGGDGSFAVSEVGEISPALVASSYVFNAVNPDSQFLDEFRVNALLALYESRKFTADGVSYSIEDADNGPVIMAGPDKVAELSIYSIRRYSGQDSLTLDFKDAAQDVIENMQSGNQSETKYVYALPEMDAEANYVYDENGELKYADAEITVSRKPTGEYVFTCAQTTYLIDIFGAPVKEHIAGTDGNGMDIFARMMYGGRVSLIVGFVVVLIELFIGIILGGISGFFGGWVDSLIMRVADIFFCVPSYPFLIIMGSFFDQLKMNPYQRLVWMMAMLGVLGWASIARLVRGQILSLREQEFMVAQEATGIRARRRIFRHLIPNVMPQLIVVSTMGVGSVIIYESTLSFLGLGVKHPLATWGTMINSVTGSSEQMIKYAYIWVPVGLLICLTVIAFNFVGDGLRDAFDPKMKR